MRDDLHNACSVGLIGHIAKYLDSELIPFVFTSSKRSPIYRGTLRNLRKKIRSISRRRCFNSGNKRLLEICDKAAEGYIRLRRGEGISLSRVQRSHLFYREIYTKALINESLEVGSISFTQFVAAYYRTRSTYTLTLPGLTRHKEPGGGGLKSE